MDTFRIGARKGDHLEVSVAAREDGGIDVTFEASAAGVSARDRASLRAGAFERFRDALLALDEGGPNEALFAADDRSLQVRISRAAADGFVAECFVVGANSGGSVLKLIVKLDAAQLAELLWALDAIARDAQS